MKIVNCKLKIVSVAAVLFLIVVPVVFVVLTPSFVQAASDCGQSTDNPSTPVNETLSCNGLVPCRGIDCTICDFFKLFQNIFNFVFKLVPIIAMLFVCIGGYYFLVSAGNPGMVSKAKGVFWNTFLGIIIFYSSYTLASFTLGFFASSEGGINFGLTRSGFTFNCSGEKLDNLVEKVFPGGVIRIDIPADVIRRKTTITIPVSTDNEEDGGSGSTAETYIGKTGDGYAYVKAGVDTRVNMDVKRALDDASDESVLESGDPELFLLVVDGRRTIEAQQALVAQNCTPYGAKTSSARRPPTCIPDLNKNGSNCQHVAGQALDVWSVNSQGQQMKDTSSQNRVIQAMKSAGFCVYNKEVWHFELKTNVIRTNRTGVFNCP